MKTVIITGAGNGIGEAISIRCLQDGFRVFACDIDTHRLTTLSKSYASDNLVAETIDVTNYSQVQSFFYKLKSNQIQAQCLVNNAGIYIGKSLLEYSLEEMQRVISVNCLGAIYFSQLFAQSLLPSSTPGVIVNMSSVAGEEGSSDAVYGLTKAAILGLTKSCAMNFAPHIRVNAVAPALVSTQLIQNVPQWRLQEYRAGELLKDPIRPESVADTVAFLLSEKSKHYTGAVLDINNGQYRR